MLGQKVAKAELRVLADFWNSEELSIVEGTWPEMRLGAEKVQAINSRAPTQPYHRCWEPTRGSWGALL